ncbi:MAG: DUF2877 domain-containing protein [Chloroflexia bacterium]
MSASSSDNSASNVWVNAATLGPEVYAFRNERNPHGRVIAVLKDAIYIESDEGHIICIAPGEGVDGPLGMRVLSFESLRSAPQVREEAEVTVSLHALTIGGTARVMWGYAEPWSPRLPHWIGTSIARLAAIGRLKSFLAETEKGGPSQVAEKMRPILLDFRQAIHEEDYGLAANAICSLLGLGEGMTPEGDDVAMGLLACAVWWAKLGKLNVRYVQLLAQVVRVFAAKTTNKISTRLLWHAGEGLLYAPAMTLGTALLAGEPGEVVEPLQKLLSVGSTTGRAVATGLLYGACLTMK